MKLYRDNQEIAEVLQFDYTPGKREIQYVRQFGSSAAIPVEGRNRPDTITFIVDELPKLRGNLELGDETGKRRQIQVVNVSFINGAAVVTAVA